MRVVIENGNSKIWNIEFVVTDIIQSIINNNKVIIDLNAEGPCCEDIGLYSILDYICDKFNLSKKNIVIETANALEQHSDYNIIKIHMSKDLYYLRDYINNSNMNKVFANTCKLFVNNYKFKNFGIFIGRPSWDRIFISSNLWKKNPDKIFGTFHWYKNSEFHLTHTNLTDLLNFTNDLDAVIDSSKFLKSAPYTIEPIESFPILLDKNCNIIEYYKNFFVDIVCETYFSGNTFLATEKTWRAIATKTPFIIHGSVDFLRNLRKLGFKTFDKWWSEEYDDYGHEARIEKILELTDELAKYSTDDLHDMYEDMSEVLEHNFRVFKELSEEDFQRVFK